MNDRKLNAQISEKKHFNGPHNKTNIDRKLQKVPWQEELITQHYNNKQWCQEANWGLNDEVLIYIPSHFCLKSLLFFFFSVKRISCVKFYRPSPCSRATDVERMARLRFRNVSEDSQSMIILVIEEGSSFVETDPTAMAAWESRRLLRFPKNCQKTIPYNQAQLA